MSGGGAHLYDGAMGYIVNLASLYPNIGSAAGVTFSADGQRLFFLDSTNQAVVVIDAYNYSLVATVQLPGAIFRTLKWSEEIVVAPDGNGIFYNTASGIAFVSVDLPGLGTDAADQLSGTAGADILDGRAGADLIFGLAGDDWLIGGAGNDLPTAVRDLTSPATRPLQAGERGPRARRRAATGGADPTLWQHRRSRRFISMSIDWQCHRQSFLAMTGTIPSGPRRGRRSTRREGNDAVRGRARWLFGGSGEDRLDGGAGADRLEGGDGNDTYIVDDAGDVVIETATGGYDTMLVSNFSATIASSVEALVIQSGEVNATGNFAANSLTGSDQANVLSGLGGNDILKAGGHDTLAGGSGIDTLSGGEGNETSRYAADLNGDTIIDFGAATASS